MKLYMILFYFCSSAVMAYIHQTAKTEESLTFQDRRYSQSWKRLHPDYKYILWTDEKLEELIKEYYPEWLNIWKTLPYGVQRGDVGRMMVLYQYGGIYCDTDTIAFQTFPISKNEYLKLHVGRQSTVHLEMAIMFAPKKHGFFLHHLKQVEKSLKRWNWMKDFMPSLYIHLTTGPFQFTRSVHDYLQTHPASIKIYTYKDFYSSVYMTHLANGTWFWSNPKMWGSIIVFVISFFGFIRFIFLIIKFKTLKIKL